MLTATRNTPKPQRVSLPLTGLKPNPFSLSIYGDPRSEIDDLLPSIRDHGILVPLVVASDETFGDWQVISGHRRLACAQILGLTKVPCEIHQLLDEVDRRHLTLEFNRQRRKSFSQLMREADAIEELWKTRAKARRLGNLRKGTNRSEPELKSSERPNSAHRNDHTETQRASVDAAEAGSSQVVGRTDAAIAQHLEIGGKDVYRQARTIWRLAKSGDIRATSALAQLDARTKTIHAAYKDLRRRNRFSRDFRPTPYDVWSFRHDRAFGIPHPGMIPPAIVAHTLHYFTHPNGIVVDPMAGGGTTIDVCQSMGRHCLAYDLSPKRPDIQYHDICDGFPREAANCDMIFCDPPYHTMLAARYTADGVASLPLAQWIKFLHKFTHQAFETLRPGGYLALLLAAQTEKDLPAGFGYIDHVFYGYIAGLRAGFMPQRRISCPMDGGYLPQHVRRAREDGRLLGQVRDLLILRKPLTSGCENAGSIDFLQGFGNAELQFQTRNQSSCS